jgi:hypothetical protein
MRRAHCTFILAAVATIGMSACSVLGPAGSRSVVIPRGMLSAVPCINDAIRSSFGTLPTYDASYMQVEHTSQPHLKQQLEVRLDPSESGKSAGTDVRRIVYEIAHKGTNAVSVRYWVDLPGALRDEFMEQAFVPLEQCGALRP